MKSTLRLTAALVSFAAVATTQDGALDYRSLLLSDGTQLEYAVKLPAGYDATAPYPVLLALPPGDQSRSMVAAGFVRYFDACVQKHGFVVVSPVAREGERFFEAGDDALAQLLRRMRIDFRVDGARFHLAGASNGGRSAIRLATRHAFQFRSLVVLPGFARADDVPRLASLADVTVRMFVGGDDGRWVERSQTTAARLNSAGVDVELTVLAGEGHVPPSLDGGVLADLLGDLHASGQRDDETVRAIDAVLDDFHDAAAKADAPRYFGHFAPEGVFLGTDATERWDLEQFRSWAGFAFERDSAWIFVPRRRHVRVAPGAAVAWFDEVAGSASYGECRGTGVLRRIDGAWRVAQYNLTVPVPNQLLGDVVERIRAGVAPDATADGTTTIYIVRHAEKGDGDDPGLTEAGAARAEALARLLAEVPIAAAFATEFRRTQGTVARVAAARGLETRVVEARDPRAVADRIRADHRGHAVVVAGHSNTVPAILSAFGVGDGVTMSEQDYGDLFVVTLDAAGHASLLRLHYGARTP